MSVDEYLFRKIYFLILKKKAQMTKMVKRHLKISVWAYNFITNKITRSLETLFLLKKNTILLSCLTIYATLLAKSHHQSKIMYMLKQISYR